MKEDSQFSDTLQMEKWFVFPCIWGVVLVLQERFLLLPLSGLVFFFFFFLVVVVIIILMYFQVIIILSTQIPFFIIFLELGAILEF